MPEPASAPGASRMRGDIEGLRAVAVLLVLIYHAGVPQLPGGFIGVDVFFVISGFLITGLLIREAERSGTISLSRFYARRARRLLPAATVVLVATAGLTAWFLPTSELRAFGQDIAAASVSVVNWVFAARSVDYAAQDMGASPVLHFWSLAVEEQFYLIWPLVILICLWVIRRTKMRLRPALAVGLTLIAVPSFAWALHLGSIQDPSGYFVTTTRLWELAAGGLAAVAVPLLERVPRGVRNVMGAAGIVAIAWGAATLEEAVGWPGVSTLLPVLGAAAVIVAGLGSNVTARILSLKPMVWIGGLSYSLYLWHWPLFTIARDGLGLDRVRYMVIASALALLLAWLSKRFIEDPVRFAPRLSRDALTPLAVGAACALVATSAGFLVALSPAVATPGSEAGDREASSADGPLGAVVLGTTPDTGMAGRALDAYPVIWQDLAVVSRDIPSYSSAECTNGPLEIDLKPCVMGDLESDVEVAAVGDSKLAQWYDVLDTAGRVNGWRITMYSKNACPFSEAARVRDGAVWEPCLEWNGLLADELLNDPPAAVITTQGSVTGLLPEHHDETSERGDDGVLGLVERWKSLDDAGIAVIVVEDNPRPPRGYDAGTCLAEHQDDALQCAFDRDQAIADSAAPGQVEAAQIAGTPAVVSVSDVLCPQALCAPVIGNVVVYRDAAHLTNTYALTTSGVMTERLADAARGLGLPVAD